MEKLVWITGARGFIGRNLAHWLASQGHCVIGIGHGLWPQDEAADWGVRHWISGDINSSNLQGLMYHFGVPDQIVHLAGGSSVSVALANPFEDFTRTVSCTASLLDWIYHAAADCGLITVSSAAVYGTGHHTAIDEDAACKPYSPYGYHKLLMEALCRSYAESFGLRVTILRLFSVYGRGLKKQLLWDLCSKLAAGSAYVELGGTGEEIRDWTEIRDVTRAFERVMNLPINNGEVRVLNVGTGHGTSVAKIVRLVLEQWPSSAPCRFNQRSRRGDPFSLVASPDSLQATGFDWKMSIEDGIRDYVQWFLHNSGSIN